MWATRMRCVWNYHHPTLTFTRFIKISLLFSLYFERTCLLPMNNWLLSCRWMCPSAGASCVAAGNSSTRNEASFTFRSARTLCHRLSFKGTFVSARTSSGPFPTSKEKMTSEEAGEEGYGQISWLRYQWSEKTTKKQRLFYDKSKRPLQSHGSRMSSACSWWRATKWKKRCVMKGYWHL